MRCERLHAVIRVSQCLANQEWQSNMGVNHKPGRPSCWGCPTGEAVRKGEFNDDDVEAMKQRRILDGMRAAKGEDNMGGLNSGVTMEMKQRAKARASEVMEQRKHKTSDEVLEEIMQKGSEEREKTETFAPEPMDPDISHAEPVNEPYQAEDATPKDVSEGACVCSECGDSFETYRRGPTMVTKICFPCLNEKISKSRVNKPRRHTVPVDASPQHPIMVDLDFTAYPELFQSLSDSAIKDFRTPAMQALFLIKQILEASHAAS